MGKRDKIASLVRNCNQFMLTANKSFIVPGRIPNVLVLNAPEYYRIPLDSTGKTAVAIERLRLRKRQRPVELDSGASGVYLGLETRWGNGYYVGKSSACDGHVLAVGTNGSGKSTIIAKATTETCRHPFVALDIKGELSEHYRYLQKKGAW